MFWHLIQPPHLHGRQMWFKVAPLPAGREGREAPVKGGAGEVRDRRAGRRRDWQCRLDVRYEETGPISIYGLKVLADTDWYKLCSMGIARISSVLKTANDWLVEEK